MSNIKNKIGIFTLYMIIPIIQAEPVILIHPMGDMSYKGRIIQGAYEADITLNWARAIQEWAQAHHPTYTVLITRSLGQTISNSAIINLANNINPHLYIVLGVYESSINKSDWYWYSYTDYKEIKRSLDSFSFCPQDQAFMIHKDKTTAIVNTIINHLNNDTYSNWWHAYSLIPLPTPLLIGITAPSCITEIGINNPYDWKKTVAPLCTIIEQTICT